MKDLEVPKKESVKSISFYNWFLLVIFGFVVLTMASYSQTGSDVIPGTSCCGAGYTLNLPGPDTYWEGVEDRKAGKAAPKGASKEYMRGYNGQ